MVIFCSGVSFLGSEGLSLAKRAKQNNSVTSVSLISYCSVRALRVSRRVVMSFMGFPFISYIPKRY